MKTNERFKEWLARLKKDKPPLYNLLWKGIALTIGLVLFFLLWTILSRTTSSVVVPGPIETLKSLLNVLSIGRTYQMLGLTLGRLLLALLFAGILGIVLGSLAGYYSFIEYVLKPIVIVLRSFPSVALMLILIIFTKNASFYLVGLVLFPIIYEGTLRGINETKREYKDVLSLEGINRIINIPKIVLPLSSNYIIVSLLQSLGLGLKVQIMGESLMGSTSYVGLGSDIYRAYLDMNMARVFALSLLAISFILIADLLTLYLKRKWNTRLLEKGKGNRSI